MDTKIVIKMKQKHNTKQLHGDHVCCDILSDYFT